MKSDLIDIKVRILKSRPKAWLVRWSASEPVWMPKSMCELNGDILTVTEAFALKKGIDPDQCELVKRPPEPPLCHYCGKQSVKTTGAEVYPRLPKLHRKTMYLCRGCNAWVGCHDGTDVPLGMLANAELRRAKQAAHAAFDPLWRDGPMTRKEAYAWLSDALDEPPKSTHIGMFDVGMCRRVIEVSNAKSAEILPRSTEVA